MAASTLAKAPNLHQFFVKTERRFAPGRHPRSQPAFRVFPTGKTEFHWRIAVLATNRTISRHKSLSYALEKCTRLNKQGGEGASNEIN